MVSFLEGTCENRLLPVFAFSGTSKYFRTMRTLFVLLAVHAGGGAALLGQIPAPQAHFSAWGQRFTPHHEALAYLHMLDAASPRMQGQVYGETFEGRTLETFVLTSEKNMARLEQIRQANLARFRGERPAADVSDVAVVWMSYGVHGNEAVCMESALEVAHTLVAGGGDIDAWLERVVVILDPSLNPDGHERYASWYTGIAGVEPDVLGSTVEHEEPWPGGRLNHYLFDMNRDWAWCTQQESKARRKAYAAWMPHVHCDFHEMGGESPYYFPPAAEPYHAAITVWQRAFQEEIGKATAREFDARKERYFTRETFDLFYPSYGDTYPTYLGAIGMTYEQGGSYGAGLALELENGEVLTLNDRISNHVVASLAAIETSSRLADRLVAEFASFCSNTVRDPWGPYAGYWVPAASNAPETLTRFVEFLGVHGFQALQVGGPAPKKPWNARSYRSFETGPVVPSAGDLFIPAAQPGGTLLQVLFDPQPVLSDSVTYDITAWCLPSAFNLDAYAVTTPVAAAGWDAWKRPDAASLTPGIGWAVRGGSLAASDFVAQALAAGLPLRVADKPFAVEGVQFPRGSVVVLAADAPDRALLPEVQVLVRQLGLVEVKTLSSGLSGAGVDMGSDALRWIQAPRVAMAWGNEVSALSAGSVWWHMEQELKYPVHRIRPSWVCNGGIDGFDVLVLPSGGYRSLRGECGERLLDWVEAGGRLVALGNALAVLDGIEGFGLRETASDAEATAREERQEEELERDRIAPHADADRRAVRSGVEGALFQTEVDTTHPLGYGYRSQYVSLKTSSQRFALMETGGNVFRLAETAAPLAGFAGASAVQDLGGTLVFGAESLGDGAAVYLVDDPLFRGFWQGAKPVFANALFFVR